MHSTAMGAKESETTMRLLFCDFCKTLEEIPDYEGSAKIDPLVEELVRRHNERDPMAHGGRDIHHSPMRLVKIEPDGPRTSDEVWEKDREEILKRLNMENKKVGMSAWVYEAMNTYAEDALTCYKRHHRPDEGSPCIDYWSDSKRIGRPTAIGKQVLKEAPKTGVADPHLCQWCPYYTVVQTNVRWKAGMYRDN